MSDEEDENHNIMDHPPLGGGNFDKVLKKNFFEELRSHVLIQRSEGV